MSSHLYNRGELPREDTFDHFERSDYARTKLTEQITTSRRDLQSVRAEWSATKERGPQYDGHEKMVPGATESRQNEWRQKLEYLESKVRFIERELQLAERALNRIR